MALLFKVDPQIEDKAKNIDGLISTANNIFQMGGAGEARKLLNTAIEDPISFQKNRLSTLIKNTAIQQFYGYDFSSSQESIKQIIDYLKENNVPTSEIQSNVDKGLSSGQSFIQNQEITKGTSALDVVLPSVLSFFAPGIASSIGSFLAPTATAATQAAIGGSLVGGTISEASGGDFLKGAISSGLGAAANTIVSPAISEAVGGGMLGSAIGQGLTSAGLAELQGGDAGQALLTGAVMGAANYVPPAQGMNSTLTPAQIESGIGTEGYGVGAQAQASGLFNPGVIGSQANTQTSYPIDMAELAAADAIQLTQQGIGIPAVEQNLVASGLDPLVAADMTQQIALTPGLTSTELANNLISTYGSNLYDTTIDQINQAAPKSTEQPALPTSADINWGALAKGLMGLLAANQAAQAVPSVQAPITGTSFRPADTMPVYSPEYFQQVQQYYNTYLPSTPRDVATPLEQWYSSGYVEPDSVTAKLFSGG